MKRIAGIDYGTVRIGLALSDPSQRIASPWKTVLNKGKETITEILSLLREQTVEAIVVGMPLQMNGQPGKAAEAVSAFIACLQEATDLPIQTIDERLTTVQVEKTMKEALSRKKRSRIIDSACAALILQSHLDIKAFSIN